MSNLFDIMSSPLNNENLSGNTSHDDSSEEKMVDIDALKQFTIPKMKKKKKGLLESISYTSREVQQELLPIIHQSYRDRGSVKNFLYEEPQLVHNDTLFNEYLNRRKEMRSNGYTEKDLAESYAFLWLENSANVKRLCQDGLFVNNVSNCCIGNPEMGVAMCKHADVVKPVNFMKKQSGYLLIFKVMKGKVKTFPESRGAGYEPVLDFDCHLSKTANADLASASPLQAYESTQLYVYEYNDELDIEKRPRQVYPYAVLKSTYVGENKVIRPPVLKPSSRPDRRRSDKKPNMPQLDPIQPHQPRRSSHETHSDVSARINDPRMPISKESRINDPRALDQHKLHPRFSSDPRINRTASVTKPIEKRAMPPVFQPLDKQRSVKSNVPNVCREPSIQSPPSVIISPKKLPVVPDASKSTDAIESKEHNLSTTPEVTSPPKPIYSSYYNYFTSTCQRSSQIGLLTETGGVVVWKGLIRRKQVTLCAAKMVMYSAPIKPARIGETLDIVSRVSITDIATHDLSELRRIITNREFPMASSYVSYAELHPVANNDAHFKHIATYLSDKQSAAVVNLEENVSVYILTVSDYTRSLGLIEHDLNHSILFCLFVSKISRSDILRDIQVRGMTCKRRRQSNRDFFNLENYIPQKSMEDIKYDFGFLSRKPESSLLTFWAVKHDFCEQLMLQDTWNIEVARNSGQLPSAETCQRLLRQVSENANSEIPQSSESTFTEQLQSPTSTGTTIPQSHRTSSERTISLDRLNSDVDTLEYPVDSMSLSTHDSSRRLSYSSVDSSQRMSVDDRINDMLYTPTPINELPGMKLTRTQHDADADSESSDMSDGLADKIIRGGLPATANRRHSKDDDDGSLSPTAPPMSPCTPPMSPYSPMAPDMSPLDDFLSDEPPVLSPKVFSTMATEKLPLPIAPSVQPDESSTNKWASHHRSTSYRPPMNEDMLATWGRTHDQPSRERPREPSREQPRESRDDVHVQQQQQHVHDQLDRSYDRRSDIDRKSSRHRYDSQSHYDKYPKRRKVDYPFEPR